MLWFGVSFRVLFLGHSQKGFCSGCHRSIPGPLDMSCFPGILRFVKKQILSSATRVQGTGLSFMLSATRWNRPVFCEEMLTPRRSVPLRNQEQSREIVQSVRCLQAQGPEFSSTSTHVKSPRYICNPSREETEAGQSLGTTGQPISINQKALGSELSNMAPFPSLMLSKPY